MGAFKRFRGARGALKDSTKVGLTKVNNEFKMLLEKMMFDHK
ncbi:hypothetical protein Hdeb2414_s0001g00033401 [Helianthus debilis subsp. tardiflorus]